MLESHLKSSSVPFSHDPISYGFVKETEHWVAGSIHLPGCPPGTKVCPEPQETPQHESWGHPGELMCRVDARRAQRVRIKRNWGPRRPWSKLGCPTKGFFWLSVTPGSRGGHRKCQRRYPGGQNPCRTSSELGLSYPALLHPRPWRGLRASQRALWRTRALQAVLLTGVKCLCISRNGFLLPHPYLLDWVWHSRLTSISTQKSEGLCTTVFRSIVANNERSPAGRTSCLLEVPLKFLSFWIILLSSLYYWCTRLL